MLWAIIFGAVFVIGILLLIIESIVCDDEPMTVGVFLMIVSFILFGIFLAIGNVAYSHDKINVCKLAEEILLLEVELVQKQAMAETLQGRERFEEDVEIEALRKTIREKRTSYASTHASLTARSRWTNPMVWFNGRFEGDPLAEAEVEVEGVPASD